jgi:hypothetical protein
MLYIDPIAAALSVACPFVALTLAVIFRRRLSNSLRAVVPQQDTRVIARAVVVGGVAGCSFLLAWICVFLLKGIPVYIYAPLFVLAAVGFLVVSGMLSSKGPPRD